MNNLKQLAILFIANIINTTYCTDLAANERSNSKNQILTFLILTQKNDYHLRLAQDLKNNIYNQYVVLKLGVPVVYLSHKDHPHIGGWVILPLIPKIAKLHQNTSSWLIICNEYTKFNLKNLLKSLHKYDSKKKIWVGQALYDREATITHHFAFHENPEKFLYPNLASGIALTMPLIKRLSKRVKMLRYSDMEFSIDAAHELSLFIWNNGSEIALQPEPTFCIQSGPNCATFVTSNKPCTEYSDEKSIYFAVKTCKKFHNDRMPVVKATWGKMAHTISYFSDFRDESIPTIDVGVPNTEHGHCSKTLSILKYMSQQIKSKTYIKWIVIADDDTLLSVSRLGKLLTCYDSSKNISLGERYGYHVLNSESGYNYITGGGAMVFSDTLVHVLSVPGACECPTDSTPDDMYIGICLARLQIEIIHNPSFHQARPNDYSPEYLATHEPVTFHKHWMIDPISVYQKWFSKYDNNIYFKHSEL